jgi:hypothetical protein
MLGRFVFQAFRFDLAQAGFAREVENELRVGIVELLPAGIVPPILEAAKQRGARWNQFGHGSLGQIMPAHAAFGKRRCFLRPIPSVYRRGRFKSVARS